jgi:hypothetical protein
VNLEWTNNLIGNKDIADAGIGHDLRLTQFSTCDAYRTGFHLPSGNGGTFVALEMGPKPTRPLREKSSHPLQVGPQGIRIQEQGRGVNISEGRYTGWGFSHSKGLKLNQWLRKSSPDGVLTES